MQETLEDIDKNGDGHVDEDEYIGKLNSLNQNEMNAFYIRWLNCILKQM